MATLENQLKMALGSSTESRLTSEDLEKMVHDSLSRLLLRDHLPAESLADSGALLDSLRQYGPRSVCQYQFKRNDIVWICKQCQQDETCVLCNDCFQSSNHKGHDVYFYHSNSGGCCDCGDCGAWSPSGFCNKHGQKVDDPRVFIPQPIANVAQPMLLAVATHLEDYCLSYAGLFEASIDVTEIEPSADHCVILHLDDFHRLAEYETVLRSLGALATVPFLQSKGFAVINLPDSEAMVNAVVDLRTKGFVCCVAPKSILQRGEALFHTMTWLYRLAQTNDGLLTMICLSLEQQMLKTILECDPHQSKHTIDALHNLLLTLMANQTFKKRLSIAYCEAFPVVARKYGRGFGLSENSLFSLSVQFLNRSYYVSHITFAHGFLTHLSSGLAEMLISAIKSDDTLSVTSNRVLVSRRYYPIIGDLKIIFTIPGVARSFLACSLKQWLEILGIFQYLHLQERQTTVHVEIESSDWIAAFNLYISLSSLFEHLVSWIGETDDEPLPEFITEGLVGEGMADHGNSAGGGGGDGGVGGGGSAQSSATKTGDGAMKGMPGGLGDDADAVSGPSGHEGRTAISFAVTSRIVKSQHVLRMADGTFELPSFVSLVGAALRHVLDWQRDVFVKDTDQYRVPSTSFHRSLDLFVIRRQFSFHLTLHRFLASILNESFKHTHLESCGKAVMLFLGENIEALSLMIDLPLHCLIFAAQIRQGMWRRNGAIMLDQLLNYADMPFCRFSRDLDILLVQFAGTLYGADRFLAHIFHRFGVLDTFTDHAIPLDHGDQVQGDAAPSSTAMAEGDGLDPTQDECDFGRGGDDSEVSKPRPMFGRMGSRSRASVAVLMAARDKAKATLESIAQTLLGSSIATADAQSLASAIQAISDADFAKPRGRDPNSLVAQYPGLLEEVLTLLILVMTELPSPPCANAEEAKKRAMTTLKRELVHRLAAEPTTFSQLVEGAAAVSGSSRLEPEEVKTLVLEISEGREASVTEPPKRILRKEQWIHYEPTFPRMTTAAHQKAFEARPKVTKPQPMVLPPTPAHASFAILRPSLITSALLLPSIRVLFLAAAATRCSSSAYAPLKEWDLRTLCSGAVFARAIHLFTLALHECAFFENCGKQSADTDVHTGEGALGSSAFESIRSHLVEVLTQVEVMVPIDEENACTDETVPTEATVVIPTMLCAMMDLNDALSTEAEETSTCSWLSWIISRCATLGPECQEYVSQRARDREQAAKAKELEAKKKRARERATKAMQKSAQSFTKHVNSSSGGVDDDDEDANAGEGGKDTSDESDDDRPCCLVCQLKGSNADDIGFLCLSQASSVLPHPSNEDTGPKSLHLGYPSTPEEKAVLKTKKHFNLHANFCGHAIHFSCFDSYLAQEHRNDRSLFVDLDRGQFQCPLCKKLNNLLVPYTFASSSGSDDKKDANCGFKHSLGKDSVDGEEERPERAQRPGWIAWIEKPSINPLFTDQSESGKKRMKSRSTPLNAEVVDKEPSSTLDAMEECGGVVDGLLAGDTSTMMDLIHSPMMVRQNFWIRFLVDLCEPLRQHSADGDDKGHNLNVGPARSLDVAQWAGCVDATIACISYSATIAFEVTDVASGEEASLSPRTPRMDVDDTSCEIVKETSEGSPRDPSLHERQEKAQMKEVEACRVLHTMTNALAATLASFSEADNLHKNFMGALCGGLNLKEGWNHKGRLSSTSGVDISSVSPSTPLLARSLLDCVVLTAAFARVPLLQDGSSNIGPIDAQRENSTACGRWLILARLVQLLCVEMLTLEPNVTSTSSSSSDSAVSTLKPAGGSVGSAGSPNSARAACCVSGFVADLVDLIGRRFVNIGQIAAVSPSSTSSIILANMNPNAAAVQRKWLLFIRQSFRLMGSGFKYSNPLPDFGTRDECACLKGALGGLGLDCLLDNAGNDDGPDRQRILSVVDGWLRDMDAHAVNDKWLGMATGHDNSATLGPHGLIPISPTYTEFHAQVMRVSGCEYPGICLQCGAVLDASGKGNCCQHVKYCCGDSGIIFLLQDHRVLLCNGLRCCYYQAPFVDEYGESHRHFKGKPLHFSAPRYKALQRLWFTHSLPSETVITRKLSACLLCDFKLTDICLAKVFLRQWRRLCPGDVPRSSSELFPAMAYLMNVEVFHQPHKRPKQLQLSSQ